MTDEVILEAAKQHANYQSNDEWIIEEFWVVQGTMYIMQEFAAKFDLKFNLVENTYC